MKKIQKKYRELSAEEQVRIIARVAADQKALDVLALDVRGLASFADFFVIMGGTSTRHVQGLADVIDQEISSKRSKPTETEGLSEGQWILLDYGDLIVHIFYHETRPLFDLEGLWHDAPRLDLSQPAPVVAEPARKRGGRKSAPAAAREMAVSGGEAPRKPVKKKAAEKTAAKAARRAAAAPAPAKPARKTTAKPARKTAPKPAGKSSGPGPKPTGGAARPAGRPAAKAAPKPRARAAGKPAGRPASPAKPKGKPAGRTKR